MTGFKWETKFAGLGFPRKLKPWVKEGLIVLLLLVAYGLVKVWFLETFPRTRLGGATWIRQLRWVFSRPVCLFFVLLMTADGVGGFGIISILITACSVRVKYFWRWMAVTGISITVLSIALPLFLRIGRKLPVLHAVIFTTALIFFFALPIYWYRSLYKKELARREG